MSASGLVRFGVAVFLIAFLYIFITPIVDTLAIIEPIGDVVSQDRIMTMGYLILGFRVAPVMFLLAFGLNLWATALMRTSAYSIGAGIRIIGLTYGSLIALLLTCVWGGAVVDEMVYILMGMPAYDQVLQLDYLLPLSWLYPFLTICIIGIYAALFVNAVNLIDYGNIKTKKGKSGKTTITDYW